MIPLLVPEISPCDGFCDAAGIGYSSSWIGYQHRHHWKHHQQHHWHHQNNLSISCFACFKCANVQFVNNQRSKCANTDTSYPFELCSHAKGGACLPGELWALAWYLSPPPPWMSLEMSNFELENGARGESQLYLLFHLIPCWLWYFDHLASPTWMLHSLIISREGLILVL